MPPPTTTTIAIAAPVSGAADGVLRLAYQPEYLAGSQALSVLAPGMACFALFVIGATILSGAGMPGRQPSIPRAGEKASAF